MAPIHPNNRDKFRFNGVLHWHNKGYTGKGVTIAISEKDDDHGTGSYEVISQIAPDAKILYRQRPGMRIISGELDSATEEKYVNYYKKLVDEGVNIISMSLSALSTPKLREIETELLVKNNILTFVSAGNDDSKPIPKNRSAFHDTWWAVGAAYFINGQPRKTEYSQIGDVLDIMALTNIFRNDTNAPFTGTSCACPTAAAQMALVVQWFYEETGRFPPRDWCAKFMFDHAYDMEDEGFDRRTGHGLLVLPNPIPDLLDTISNKPDAFIELTTGETTYKVNGIEHKMDVAPIIKNDRTLVPIRFIAEALGYKVDWEEISRGKIRVLISK